MKNMSPLVFLSLVILSFSCAKPTVFSGAELPEDQRAFFASGSGIDIHTIDGIDVDGRSFIMAPGTYAIEFTSTRDRKQANQMLKGILDIADCRTDMSLEAGEQLMLSSRVKGSLNNIEHSIKFTSSNDERSKTMSANSCERSVDCARADRLQIVAAGCE